jgi:hypothetical protein
MSAQVERAGELGIMVDSKNHPVWNLYNEMRTARLNVKCLLTEICSLRQWNRFVEISLAISSTSSIGGFWFFQNAVGGYVWKTVGSFAVILTVLKPIFKFNERIRKKQQDVVGYQTLEHDLRCIAIEVQHRQRYDEELRKELMKVLRRKAELIKKDDGESFDKTCQQKFEEEVDREMPADSFYIPPQ